jgi:hypothetical protein
MIEPRVQLLNVIRALQKRAAGVDETTGNKVTCRVRQMEKYLETLTEESRDNYKSLSDKQRGYEERKRVMLERFAARAFRKAGTAALTISLTLSWPHETMAQGQSEASERSKAELEVEKLKLEVAQLKGPYIWGWLLPGIFGLLTGVAAAATSLWVAYLGRLGAVDQAVHEKRLKSYPSLVKPASRFALYFPGDDPDAKTSVAPADCRAMGRALAEWYFGTGGLLLSDGARDAYFRLARALTRASLANDLKVPQFPTDAENISKEKVDDYQKLLVEQNLSLDDVNKWEFGSASEKEAPDPRLHMKFKDYVFLQRLSSQLRTQLTKDLRSRRRPAR